MHKCVRCSKEYSNTSPELLKGCECGSRVFVFLKHPGSGEQEEDYSWLESEFKALSKTQTVSVEKDAAENLKVLEKGSYELDVKSLMGGNPLVVKSEKGIYYIQMPGSKT
ncbi:MAG TPA: Zn-ribbon containing protein [Candidatus Norongarragalinales archaeon]|nr:Zn-ribbon containing protein [Candidatus Norongarragalinales archaeon]